MNELRSGRTENERYPFATDICPACLSISTFEYTGSEFRGCNLCATISAKDRRTTAVYDETYVAERYDRYPTTRPMSLLRYRMMMSVLNLYESVESGKPYVVPGPLLDVGYGNGDFIRLCLERGWNAYGNDVNPTKYLGVEQVPLPSNTWPNYYKVVTFFDALEHFEDLRQVRWVSHFTDWIIASFPTVAPEFPYKTEGFKHYRPGEHHLYFEPTGLETIFSFDERLAKVVYIGCPEDTIRGKRADGGRNITTVVLRCSNA